MENLAASLGPRGKTTPLAAAVLPGLARFMTKTVLVELSTMALAVLERELVVLVMLCGACEASGPMCMWLALISCRERLGLETLRQKAFFGGTRSVLALARLGVRRACEI